MAGREVIARAVSMSARIRIGGAEVDGVLECRSGRVFRRMSVIKRRSDAEFTLGITSVSILLEACS